MEEAFLSKKFRQALDEYTSYDGKKLDFVVPYLKEAERILKANENSLNHDKLKTLVSKCVEKIVKNNFGLVVNIAREYSYKKGRESYYDDFFQEGVIGLLRAIPGYNPEKGEFSNYAGAAIRQGIKRRMHETLENIRVPVNSYFNLKKMRIFSDIFKERYKREPSDEELAEFSGEPIRRIKSLRNVKTLLKTRSLDAKVNSEEREGRYLMDYCINPSEISPEEECIRKTISEEAIKYVGKIPNKEDRAVLLERLEGKTLDEIAIEKSITREGVRQRELRAVRRARRMREFYRLR